MSISYDQILEATRPGGPSTLTSVTLLEPASGSHGAIAPARYVAGRSSTYAYETRFVDGEAQRCVLVDSKASQLNRAEDALRLAIEDESPVLSRLPRVRVTYEDQQLTDLDLPHRVFDGHIRAGTANGRPTTETPEYQAVRNVTHANAKPLLEMSPVSLTFGCWDSTRKSHQVRFRSCLVGEIVGVMADQSGQVVEDRGNARTDPYAPSVRVSGDQMRALIDGQRRELSSKNIEGIEGDIKKAGKNGTISASVLGLGHIPPTLETPGLVACRQIIRSHVVSFAALRQLRFGAGAEGDAACRALLAALILNAVTRSNSELVLRANCDLVEAGATTCVLDRRQGQQEDLILPSIVEADQLLEEAMATAESKAGVVWQGQVFEVTGNPIIANAQSAEEDDEQ